jgi:hypothetical protein
MAHSGAPVKAVWSDLGAGEEKSLERPVSARLRRAQPEPSVYCCPLATFAALIAHLARERQPKTGAGAQGGAKQPHGGA